MNRHGMIPGHVEMGALMTDGLRAGAMLRWLEQSGPRYVETTVRLVKVEDDVAVLDTEEGQLRLTCRLMSFASWRIILDAHPGAMVTIKVRTDDASFNFET